MSINVVCTGCHKSFQVSDKFAGKSGPCPKCKTVIQVPTKEQEVKVHAPTEFAGGGRGASGELVTKPIARKETRVEPVMAVAVAAGGLTVLAIAWAGGKAGLFADNWLMCGLGLLLVSPPLVLAAYSFLRDDELQPHRGTSLYVRTAICSVAYVVLWGVYGYLTGGQLLGTVLTGQLWEWLFVVPPFLAAGALVALVCFDLDFGSGFFHYSFYVLLTVLLRAVAGMGWAWDVTLAAGV